MSMLQSDPPDGHEPVKTQDAERQIVVIRTVRLILRPARTSDLEDLHLIMSDPAVMRYWSTEAHRDRAETERYLAPMVGEAHRGLDFMLEMDGRIIGKAGAWNPPEIGFLLGRDHWGHGLMEEALRAIIPHLFAVTELPQLTADADPRNEASLRLLTKVGFQETGRAERTFFTHGEWTDSVYLACPRRS